MKLIGLVFLGLIASFAAGALIVFLLMLLSKATGNTGSGSAGEAGLLIGFLGLYPSSFFIGSIVTGYFSYYDIENKSSLYLMAPVLYMNLVWACVAGVRFALDAFIGVNPPGPGFLRNILVSVAIGLLWYITSAGGVFFGYYLRERFAKWWYGD